MAGTGVGDNGDFVRHRGVSTPQLFSTTEEP